MDELCGVGWRFLRQWWKVPPEMSYSAPSGLTRKTIQISREFTIPGDPRIDAVAVDEPVEDVEGHLGGHVLVGVVSAVEHDLGLVLVDGDVVGDLDRPQLAALVARPDREALDDVGVRRGDGRDLGRQLRVAVIALPARGELGGGRHGRAEHGQDDREDQPDRGGASTTMRDV